MRDNSGLPGLQHCFRELFAGHVPIHMLSRRMRFVEVEGSFLLTTICLNRNIGLQGLGSRFLFELTPAASVVKAMLCHRLTPSAMRLLAVESVPGNSPWCCTGKLPEALCRDHVIGRPATRVGQRLKGSSHDL